MRDEVEVVRAHDLITAALLDEKLRNHMGAEEQKLYIAAADVLCWVLGHFHNQNFGMNLEALEGWALQNGYELRMMQ